MVVLLTLVLTMAGFSAGFYRNPCQSEIDQQNSSLLGIRECAVTAYKTDRASLEVIMNRCLSRYKDLITIVIAYQICTEKNSLISTGEGVKR